MLKSVIRNGIQLWGKNHIGTTDMGQDTSRLIDSDNVELIGENIREDDCYGRQLRAKGKD